MNNKEGLRGDAGPFLSGITCLPLGWSYPVRMRRLIFFLLMIVALIALDALFRWSTGMGLSWGWLAERTAFSIVLISVLTWSSRRDAKRSQKLGARRGSIWTGIMAVLLGGPLLFVAGWRAVDALLTGKVVVSLTPATYASWHADPQGFAIAFGLDLLAVMVFFVFFSAGVLIVGDWLARRKHALA